MLYVYACDDCAVSKKMAKRKNMVDYDNNTPGWHHGTGEYLFMIECGMKEMPATPECPNCKKMHTRRSFTDNGVQSYIRGNCYLDKVGAKRDLQKFKYRYEDPYANMRVSGEVDQKVQDLTNAGRDMSKEKEARAKRVRGLIENAEDASKNLVDSLSDDEKTVVRFISGNEVSDRAGLMFSQMPNVVDINKTLTDLISKVLVSQRKNGNFSLTAEGRWVADRI